MKTDDNLSSISARQQTKKANLVTPSTKKIASRVPSVDAFSPDWSALSECIHAYRQTSTNADGLREIVRVAANCLRVSPDIIEQLLKYECGYPSRPLYRSDMPRDGDRGVSRYIGVTQASQGFWTDAGAIAQAAGIEWPRRAVDATLLQQLVAPFFYYLRYVKQMTGYPFSADTLYALHQQGPGAARSGFQTVTGRQSAASLVSVRKAAASRRVAL